VEVCLDLETFRILVQRLCVTPKHPLVNPATSDLICLFVLEGLANQATVGCRRQSPYGRAI